MTSKVRQHVVQRRDGSGGRLTERIFTTSGDRIAATWSW